MTYRGAATIATSGECAPKVAVGVRQLKNSLTRYLRLVEKGHSVLAISRNRPVAVLRKPDRNTARTQEELIAALVAEGKLLPAGEARPSPAVQATEAEREPVFPVNH